MTTDEIARVAHEVNRAYCLALGDNSQPHWEGAPAWLREKGVALEIRTDGIYADGVLVATVERE